jgi:hypothetical protein
MLQIAVKTINNSVGPDGIVFILLIFGVYLWLTKRNPFSPLVTKRAKAICVVTKKVCCLYTKRQVKDVFAIHNSLNTKNTLDLLL